MPLRNTFRVKRGPSTGSATNRGSMRSRDALEACRSTTTMFSTPPPGCMTSVSWWDKEKVDAVVEAIRTHQVPAYPVTIESILIRDADILEQLGAIGILRTVSKIGRDTRFPTLTSAAESLRNALTTLPPQMRLDTRRSLAQPKIELLRVLLAALQAEFQPALY